MNLRNPVPRGFPGLVEARRREDKGKDWKMRLKKSREVEESRRWWRSKGRLEGGGEGGEGGGSGGGGGGGEK